MTNRILSDGKNTTIFGSSLEGIISFYAAVKFPKSFRKSEIYSPPFLMNKEIFELIKEPKKIKS